MTTKNLKILAGVEIGCAIIIGFLFVDLYRRNNEMERRLDNFVSPKSFILPPLEGNFESVVQGDPGI